MHYDPIHHSDVMRAMRDPDVRMASARIASPVYTIGAILVFGPVLYFLAICFWNTLSVLLKIALGIVGVGVICLIVFIIAILVIDKTNPHK